MPKQRSKLQLYAELYALKAVLGFLSILPLRFAMGVGKRIGAFLGGRFKKLRKIAYRNLDIAFPNIPEAKKHEILRGTFEAIGRHLAFVAHFRHFQKKDVRRLIELENRKNIYRAWARERGMLFITGHFGSWEIFNLLSPAFGESINVLVRRIDNKLVEEHVDALRTKFGTVTLGKREAPRRMYRILDAGGMLGILADLNAQLHDGVFVDFFGVPACTTASIAKIALKTNALIIPTFAVWEEEKQKYVIYFEEAIDIERSDDPKRDIEEITRKFTEVVEKYVRKYPEQWLWIHKRWNTRPPGEKGLY